MVQYCIYGLLLLIPLLGIAALFSITARKLNAHKSALVNWIAQSTLRVWGVLCVASWLCLWAIYSYNNRTSYAPGYTEQHFRQVTLGMSQKQVHALLGDPLFKWAPYKNNLFYSEKQRYTGYSYSEPYSYTPGLKQEDTADEWEIREIYFDRGRVAEIISYRFYLDKEIINEALSFGP